MPPYFFTVSETGHDVAEQNVETPVGSLAPHKFLKLTEINLEFAEIPQEDSSEDLLNYMIWVYMYDYIGLAIPSSRVQLHHVINSVVTVMHDVFPLYKDYDKDSISLKKTFKRDVNWEVIKNVLGFEFDGNPRDHIIWPTDDHRTDILAKL